MKNRLWQILFGIALVVFSALFYLLHYFLFKDAHHIFVYLIGDIAFVFIEVLLVTLILHQLLNNREKKERLEKLNLVIGSFYSEMGLKLLRLFCSNDKGINKIQSKLKFDSEWINNDFKSIKSMISSYDFEIQLNKSLLDQLYDYLNLKRDFLLRILENPTLHEHEIFTDLIQAIFHICDELCVRSESNGEIPLTDYNHLTVDIKRAYSLCVLQWIDYAQYLKSNYPFLYSFASNNNPLLLKTK